jgi:hypothetical protein
MIISSTCNIVTEEISETRVYFPYLVKYKVFYMLNLSPRIQHEKRSGNIIPQTSRCGLLLSRNVPPISSKYAAAWDPAPVWTFYTGGKFFLLPEIKP